MRRHVSRLTDEDGEVLFNCEVGRGGLWSGMREYLLLGISNAFQDLEL